MKKLSIRNILPWKPAYLKINFYHTIANILYKRKINFLSKIFNHKISKRYNCYIARGAEIGENLILPHPTGIVIGMGVKIGRNVRIYQNVTIGRKKADDEKYPSIGDNVIIYCNSTIIGDIKIGSNAIIGCNSVVLRDVKDGETVSGVVK